MSYNFETEEPMKVLGIIAELNPFHNGHKYFIEEAKKSTGCDCVIAIMSGNYVQRGMPAIYDKFTRCKMALSYGVDLVLELPTLFSTSSAELFAKSAVCALMHTGVITNLCFGGENNDLSAFLQYSRLFIDEPPIFQEKLNQGLKSGLSFPAARKKAAVSYLEQHNNFTAASFLDTPNNILGVEYMKALLSFSSTIKPSVVKRKESAHHSLSLSNPIVSASALRNLISEQNDLQQLAPFVPEKVLEILNHTSYYSTDIKALEQALLYKLLTEEDFSSYLDCSPMLSDKINNYKYQYTKYDSFLASLKSKDITMTRLQRMLLHILLNIKESDYLQMKDSGFITYLRPLGLKRSSSALIKAIKKNSDLPYLEHPKDYKKLLSQDNAKQFEKELFAAHLYKKFSTTTTPFVHEFQQSLILQ